MYQEINRNFFFLTIISLFSLKMLADNITRFKFSSIDLFFKIDF